MNNPLASIASLDLRQVPDQILHDMMVAIEREFARRNGAKAKNREIFRSVMARIKGSAPCGRSQEDLFHQGWQEIYSNRGASNERRFYVYAHVRPAPGFMEVMTEREQFVGVRLPGYPFYIGKGCGDRAFDLARNQGHGAEIRQLLKEGVQPAEIAHILVDNLTEAEALMIEAKLIYILGTRYEHDSSGILVNLDIPPVPEELKTIRTKRLTVNQRIKADKAARQKTPVG